MPQDANSNPLPRALRTARGLSQLEVAAKARLSLGTVRTAENGAMTRRTARRLALVFGVPVEVLTQGGTPAT